MLARSLAACWIVLLAGSLATAQETPKEYKDLEKMVVKLFEAYNQDDAKGVFADYISALKGLDSAQLYNALFKPHKETCGKYKKHTFRKDGSSHSDDVVLMVLDVEFDKKKAKVSVNFGKEDGKMKIQQVTIEPK